LNDKRPLYGFNQSQASLRKELDQIQKRLSRLIDEHLDGNIDVGIYQQKLQEYKKRQREITREMEAHVDADETCLLTIKTVVDLARRAKEIYLSSNLDEKRELLNLVFSNLKLRDKRLLVTLREPFSLLMAVSHQPMCQTLDTVRTFPWKDYQQKLVKYPIFNSQLSEEMRLKINNT
jgi:site-specific DNA recombinase